MANAATIINDTMSLDEKLAAIDAAMAAAQSQAHDDAMSGQVVAPFDPSDLTICDSCQ
jgi:hypothetical protein